MKSENGASRLKSASIKSVITLAVIYLNLTILYGNIAVILNDSPLKTQLPTVTGQLDLFNLFGVFAYYEKRNVEIVIQGRLADSGECRQASRWIRLDTQEYFPYWRGEQQSRAWTSRHYVAGGSKDQYKALKGLALKIQNRYNRQHPSCLIDRVNILTENWPRSPQGYYALKTPANTKAYYWYREAPQ